MQEDWNGAVAVVVGGSTGIGLALAKELASEGMDLVLASRSPAKLEKAAASLEGCGRRVLTFECDVADRTQVHALADFANATLGPVDLICANAGATSVGRFLDHRDSDWDWAIDLNLRGTTNCVQAFYPTMATRRMGTILLTGSQTTLPPDWVSNHGPYVAAKAAVFALAISLRAEAAEYGVNVSLLLPAGTETDIAATARFVGDVNSLAAIAPDPQRPSPLPNFPFYISPEEVAERAIAGLRRNAPIIVTGAAMKPLVEDYFRRILSAYNDAAQFRRRD